MIRRRRTTESGGGVLSFTFLDVLTCTMGSLVLLLVVLAQRSTDVTLEEALKNAHKPRAAAGDPLPTGPNTTNVAAEAASPGSAEPTSVEENQLTPEELAKNLAELREQMPRLEKLRLEAAERAKAEEERVSHLEDHERRLEHELGKLHVALARLEESEKKQSVDQKTAEHELERLRKLVDDTEAQVESMKKESTGSKSYAIVPYKGANGTFRRPIYIECTKDAVTIYPEGIKLTAADFDGPLRSGNPLAASIRAAREELNSRAKAAGQTNLPDPYPLLIVRPDGAYAYGAATSAISSWDSDFGYEFVDADWKLEYPAYDPRLDQVMRHAVDQARQRQAMLAKAAPRRYGSRLALGVGEGGDGGGDGSGGGGSGGAFEGVAHPGGSGERIGDHSGENWMQASGGNGNGNGAGAGGGSQQGGGRYADNGSAGGLGAAGAGGSTGNLSEQTAGGLGGTQQSAGGQSAGAGSPGSPGSAGQQPGSGSATALAAGAQRGEVGGQTNTAPAGDAAAGQTGGSPGGDSAQGSAQQSGGPSSSAMAGGAGGGSAGGNQSGANSAGGGGASGGSGNSDGANNGGASGGIVQYNSGQTASAAQSRGANWANGAASRRASAITRPIRVIVQPSQIDVVPDADAGGATPTAITFHQSTDKVLDQLAATVQERIKDWGLAGNGMYWRPTLVLQVSPGAEQHAIRLNDLLRDSGVDVRFEEVASRTEEGGQSGPR